MLTEEERKERDRANKRKYYLKNKTKLKETRNVYSKENRDRIREYNRAYKVDNSDILKLKHDVWYRQNRDKRLKYNKEYANANKQTITANQKDRTARLTDGYVASKLYHRSNLSSKDIPQSLIMAKRAEIKLKRLIREQ